ncbi:MAG TPA: DUF427 domain-containing protein [Anaerolineales bacterium]|jgi:uncharacterized protein (DUF427 family)|nr:DUF427 domain-containing protein [Anaerolineales bacterium]
MMRAIWNGAVLAESDRTILVEGNHYFPPETIRWDYFKESETHTVCAWKGTASYYHLEVAGEFNRDAAWFYQSPSERARQIAGYIAFWRGVKVERI